VYSDDSEKSSASLRCPIDFGIPLCASTAEQSRLFLTEERLSLFLSASIRESADSKSSISLGAFSIVQHPQKKQKASGTAAIAIAAKTIPTRTDTFRITGPRVSFLGLDEEPFWPSVCAGGAMGDSVTGALSDVLFAS
jgi:hypothetical protein